MKKLLIGILLVMSLLLVTQAVSAVTPSCNYYEWRCYGACGGEEFRLVGMDGDTATANCFDFSEKEHYSPCPWLGRWWMAGGVCYY